MNKKSLPVSGILILLISLGYLLPTCNFSFNPGCAVAHGIDSSFVPRGTGPTDSERVIAIEDPLFVFATIADSHITSAGMHDDWIYLKARSIAAELLACYVRDINAHAPPVDFVIHLGDITESGKESEFRRAKSILDSLRSPLCAVVGNHDNFQSDGKAGWKQFARTESTNYAFDCRGFHFVVIDCTPDPYGSTPITCGNALRAWVAEDLSANSHKPTFLFSHYNLLKRPWGARFDFLRHYEEYRGMSELRQILENAGNIVAVINGHVHANRVTLHNGIHYIDIGATLVGRPSIRYFLVFSDRVEVMYEYISDEVLLARVVEVSTHCTDCPEPMNISEFIDGEDSDKRFTVSVENLDRHSDR